MISVEQWRASIGLYHPGSHRQQSLILGERQLAPTPFYHLVVTIMLVLILVKLLVCIVLFFRIQINGYSLLKGGLTRIITSKRTSGTQLQVSVYAIGQVVLEANSGCLERSIRAMAILLIMAGDVEENPGPLPPASASPESRALCHHSVSLIKAIGDPLMLSWKLLSSGIIDMATKDKANLPTMTTIMKNDVLLSAVMSRVGIDPSLYHRFVDLLKDDSDDILSSLGRKLEDTYSKSVNVEHSPPSPTKQVEYSLAPPMKRAKRSLPPTMKRAKRLPPPPTKQAKHSPPPSVSPSPFLLFVSFLRSFYNSDIPLSYCKWPPVQKQKYINLAAISREAVTSKELKQFMLATLHGNVDEILETKTPINLDEIFETKPGKTLHCVLVEGAPGVGKTTLSWEICKKWGRRELFQQYTAVLLLKLRDRTVQNAKNITDLIFYMYYNEDKDYTTNISQYMIQTKGKDILIILEGLDELPKQLLNPHTDQPSIFTCLLSRQLLPDATILVTSRPSATAQLRKGWKISRHIEVLGFTEKDISNYIHNALSPQEISAFDSYLSTNPNIRLAMYIPLNCAIVVEVYRSCQQSGHPPPKTTTELYTCLVQTILLRYLDSHPHYNNDTIDVDKFTDLPLPVYQQFYKLIQMAYDGVQSQQLTFHDQHTTIEHLGFMDAVMELFPRPTKHSVTYSYNFLHLSLQEFLAAYFISLQSIDVQQQLLRTICKERHLRNMGRFLAGITKYQGMDRATVKAVVEQECKKDDNSSLELSPYTLQLLHESGDYSIIDGHSSCYCKLTNYSPLLDFAVLGHCIAKSSYNWSLVLGGTGQYMQSTDRVTMFVKTLNSHSNPSYSIKNITCYYEALECVQHLLLELPQHALQQVQRLMLYSSMRIRHPLPLPLLEHILSKMNKLHTLVLVNGAISTTGAVAMAELIEYNNTIRWVSLVNNAVGAEGVEALEKIRDIKKDLKLFIGQ